MTTAEINAYLDWRAEREGKTVDVSPEAYERHQIIQKIFGIANFLHVNQVLAFPELDELYNLVRMYELLEEN